MFSYVARRTTLYKSAKGEVTIAISETDPHLEDSIFLNISSRMITELRQEFLQIQKQIELEEKINSTTP